MSKKSFSRRDFLKVAFFAILASVLAFRKRIFGFLKPEPIPTTTNTSTPLPTNISTPTNTPTSTSTPTPTSTSTNTPIPCFFLLSPEDEATLPQIGRQEFKWEEQFGGVSYELEITIPGGTPILFTTDQTIFALYLETLRWSGEYLWKVTAFDENVEIICITEPYRFYKIAPEKKAGDGGGDDGNDGIGGEEWDFGTEWDQ